MLWVIRKTFKLLSLVQLVLKYALFWTEIHGILKNHLENNAFFGAFPRLTPEQQVSNTCMCAVVFLK